MLRATPSALTDSHQGAPPESQLERSLELSDIFGFLKQQWRLIALVTLGMLSFAAVYLMLTPPRYTAEAVLMLDTRRLPIFQQQSVLGETNFDTAAVESQLELLKSRAIAVSVINRLGLLKDPEFTGESRTIAGAGIAMLKEGMIGKIIADIVTPVSSAAKNLFGIEDEKPAELDSEAALMSVALGRVSDNLTITRAGKSYAIIVGFTSLDPDKAARIANAVGEVYIADQLQTRSISAKRAAAWLQERIANLRQEALEADRLALEFRTKNNMVDAGGRLLSEQQLTEVSTQLVLAKARAQEAKARLERINELGLRGLGDAVMTDALQNTVLTKLQEQFVNAARREAEVSARYGRDHPAAVNSRKDMDTIREVSRAEVSRIAASLNSEYEIARNREKALQASLNELTSASAGTREAQVGLRVLESSANAYRTLHDSFLQRFVEATQQQSSPSTEARLITEAATGDKTHPKSLFVLGLAGLLGIGLGCGTAFAREMLDHAFRGARQVEQTLGVECVGIIPAVKDRRVRAWRGRDPGATDAGLRMTVADPGVVRHVVVAPYSRFAETIRSIKVAADTSIRSRDIKVIGMASSVPGEGKSTVASNLAQLVAHSGRRGLLIDADLRRPALSRRLTPDATAGLVEVLNDQVSLADAIWRDPITGLDFLPTVVQKPIAHTSEVVASPQMGRLLEAARDLYDYIIVDFPPLATVVDARAAAHHIDAFVLVIAWGETSPAVVREALESSEIVSSKLLGAVLNRADISRLKRLEGYKGDKYHEYYGSFRNS